MGEVSEARTLGIEEEYLLVDCATRDLVVDPPPSILEECETLIGGQVAPELLRPQIEIGTRVCTTIKEARADLARLRAAVSQVAERHGLAPIAVSTHPFACWKQQRATDKDRYRAIADEMEVVARRALICGMHVHVGIEDPDLRIELMNQARYFLPYLLVLSTSSPFWEGEETGLMSYRLSVFHNLPRTGMPERFESFGEFEALIARLVSAGVLEDGTKLWWDLRPSVRFPTLEMRIADVCTRLEDAVTVAAIYHCVLHRLCRLREEDRPWSLSPNFLLEENRWRAQRYGSEGALIDIGSWRAVPFPLLLEETLALIREDAEALDCLAEVEHAHEIVARGTSAHTQRHVYTAALAAGADQAEALRAVVDWLIAETVHGLDAAPAPGDAAQPDVAEAIQRPGTGP